MKNLQEMSLKEIKVINGGFSYPGGVVSGAGPAETQGALGIWHAAGDFIRGFWNGLG